MALSYKVFPGTPYYSNTTLTTKAGEIVNTTAATYVNTTYGTVSVGGSTYYVAYGQMVSFYNSSFTGAQIDDAVNKVRNPDTTPTANSTALITSGGVKSALDNVEALTAIRLSDPAESSVSRGAIVNYNGGSYLVVDAIASGETASSFASKLRAYPDGAINGLFDGIKFKTYTATTTGLTIKFRSGYRGLFFVFDSTGSRNGLYMMATTGAGNVILKTISAADETTITTSVQNRITITPSTGSRVILLISASGFPNDQ